MSAMDTSRPSSRSGIAALVVLAAVGAALAQPGGEGATPKPVEKTWGPPQVGLQTRVEVKGTAKIGQPILFTCELRNAGTEPVQLQPKAMFAWLFIVQQLGRAKSAVLTEKIFLAGEMDPWLKGTTTHPFKPMDVGAAKVYASRGGLKVRGGYPTPPPGSEPLRPIGVLRDKVLLGPARARLMLYVTFEEASRPRLLVSNTLTFWVQPPESKKLSDMTPEVREAYLKSLIAMFKASATGGMKAHGICVGLGKEIVPHLIQAIEEPGLAYHAAAWMAAALCHIRDERAVAALLEILEKGRGDLHAIIAYHGPGQRDAKLDAAIIKRVATGKGTGVTALAALGFMVTRGRVPEEVLKAGLESDDASVRGKVADVMKGQASNANVDRAVALLKDKDEKVRGVAARALGFMVTGKHDRSTRAAKALVEALDTPGGYARHRICEALSKLFSHEMPYDPKAPQTERNKVIAAWKAKWAEFRKARHEKP